jgi:hypothetical protein
MSFAEGTYPNPRILEASPSKMEGKQIGCGSLVRFMVRTNSTAEARAPGQRTSSDGAVGVVGDPVAMISGETIGQLMQMQSGFMELRELRERERALSQKLVEVLRSAMLELDIAIPLSISTLSTTFANVHEGWLSPDSTVVVTDSGGSKKSIPLQDLPPNTIASILQECAIRMNEVLSHKLDRVGRSIDLLEKAVQGLSMTTKRADQEVSTAAEPQRQAKPSEFPNEKGESPQAGGVETEGGSAKEEVKRFSFTGNY